MFYAPTVVGSLNLQATLSAGSAASAGPPPSPHHPIMCSSVLLFYEDGRFACEHAEVPAGDPRTQACLDHSVSILLIELLHHREVG